VSDGRDGRKDFSSRRKILLVVAALVVLAIVLFFDLQNNSRRTPLGPIHKARMAESHPPSGWERVEIPIRQFLRVSKPRAIDLGSANLEWSLANNGTSPKTGWLYLGGWEFAPCKCIRLTEVTREDLNCEFYGKHHPGAKNTFGQSWRTNALLVSEGQILLVRSTTNTPVVYVVRIAKQEGGDAWGGVRVQFIQVDCKRRTSGY